MACTIPISGSGDGLPFMKILSDSRRCASARRPEARAVQVYGSDQLTRFGHLTGVPRKPIVTGARPDCYDIGNSHLRKSSVAITRNTSTMAVGVKR